VPTTKGTSVRARTSKSTAKRPAKKKGPKTRASPIRAFKSQKDFETWLARNHPQTEGVWIRFAKKGSGIKSVTHPEALESALCYGWIDALRLPESDTTYLQRFLPRRSRSLWPKINREQAVGLIESGRMHSAGLAEGERAKRDGRWEAAYDSPRNVQIPPEFQVALDRNPHAKAAFETLDRINRYAMIWRIHVAKRPETRERHICRFIGMLEKGEKLH